MVFFTSGNSCQFWGSNTGFFGSGDALASSRFHPHVCRTEHTLRELQEDDHGGDRSEGNGYQLGELVAREVLDQLRGHIFWLLFVTNDRSKEIVTGVVQHRAQVFGANVTDEESRSEGKGECYVVDGNRHRATFPRFIFTPDHPDRAGHVMIITLRSLILHTRIQRVFRAFLRM